MWLGADLTADSLEGSPVDRLFFLLMILLALITLIRRRLDWGAFAHRNWPILLFYAYFLLSVTWADAPSASFKRLFKDFGNVLMALVILSERNSEQALRAVFVRCAYLWMPLSVIYIRFFPAVGRVYLRSGEAEPVGVTTQKNSLGAMVLVCGIVLIWDWFERTRPTARVRTRLDRYLPFAMFVLGAYLLYLCDSKTSILCLGLSVAVLFAIRFPLLRQRVSFFGKYAIVGGCSLYLLDSLFGISESIVSAMGRDMTFTGRTEVWKVLLGLGTNPLIGTGFCSFWSDAYYQSQLPTWIAFSAHNGYIETYIDGGWIGLGVLSVLLLTTFTRINRQLGRTGDYALLRFSVLITVLIGNFSESHFGRINPVWLFFLIIAVEPASVRRLVTSFPRTSARSPMFAQA